VEIIKFSIPPTRQHRSSDRNPQIYPEKDIIARLRSGSIASPRSPRYWSKSHFTAARSSRVSPFRHAATGERQTQADDAEAEETENAPLRGPRLSHHRLGRANTSLARKLNAPALESARLRTRPKYPTTPPPTPRSDRGNVGRPNIRLAPDHCQRTKPDSNHFGANILQ